MNFIVKQFDPYEQALRDLDEFNKSLPHERDCSEEELIRLIAHRIKQHVG